MAPSYIVDDPDQKIFLLDRIAHVSEDILAQEGIRIFGKCWIYVGHSSELKKPGDFHSRIVAGRPVIFCRTRSGEIRCLLNTCRHRGAIVCTQRSGNTRRFQCIYHGWTYDIDGKLVGLPGDDAYSGAFSRAELGLRSPPKFESY